MSLWCKTSRSLADGFILEEEVELIEGETGNIAMLLFLQV